MTAFDNLVFEGGGVRGIAFAGALKALEEQRLLTSVRRVAGASAGAFAALLVSMGATSEGLASALKSIHFETLEDSPNPLRLATHYGLYKGDVLYNWIEAQVTNAGLPADVTFNGLAASGARDLKVFATDLTSCNTREFSAECTPDTSVVGAVRASMSIPLMYSAWQFPDGKPDNNIYVDGGTVYNYPIDAFDGLGAGAGQTLGFCFRNAATPSRPIDGMFSFAKSLFAALLKAQTIDFMQDPALVARSVLIDDLGFHATDLTLSDDGFDQLFASGYKATADYLAVTKI
ncbi:patatin-like phospholipase family protein [Kordiimonas gwangyangensis]|uniref:patatin-like phospholipase family protein n=1 Tax=Kordiimonas gwangyangensis TaxID=288022 RepID=UPI00036BECFA|nr:patatin-like phospholipase family protein [Kordiimonas gwangyangensis]